MPRPCTNPVSGTIRRWLDLGVNEAKIPRELRNRSSEAIEALADLTGHKSLPIPARVPADDMGLGKTTQTIVAAAALHETVPSMPRPLAHPSPQPRDRRFLSRRSRAVRSPCRPRTLSSVRAAHWLPSICQAAMPSISPIDLQIIEGSEDATYSEAKFLQVENLIQRFRGREGSTDAARRWTRRVTIEKCREERAASRPGTNLGRTSLHRRGSERCCRVLGFVTGAPLGLRIPVTFVPATQHRKPAGLGTGENDSQGDMRWRLPIGSVRNGGTRTRRFVPRR